MDEENLDKVQQEKSNPAYLRPANAKLVCHQFTRFWQVRENRRAIHAKQTQAN
jgi:hypothetical protein